MRSIQRGLSITDASLIGEDQPELTVGISWVRFRPFAIVQGMFFSEDLGHDASELQHQIFVLLYVSKSETARKALLTDGTPRRTPFR